ncbi:hypothetical protein IF2G_06393 [Cordyceps javanica]|nr:hypothetical protein IF2G_06393 [Cordyceps javanica]
MRNSHLLISWNMKRGVWSFRWSNSASGRSTGVLSSSGWTLGDFVLQLSAANFESVQTISNYRLLCGRCGRCGPISRGLLRV